MITEPSPGLTVTIRGGGVGTVGGFLIALEGHRSLAVVVVGETKEVVGQ